MIPGILSGLLCAISHSLCYLASKHHAIRHPGHPIHLLLHGHLLMAGVAVPLTVWFWPDALPQPTLLLGFLAGSTAFYAVAQGFMIAAMNHTEPSRVSPLLGIKVLLMGLFAWGILGADLSGRQWTALLFCTCGAVALGISGGRLPTRAAFLILLAAAGYVISDLCIERVLRLFAADGRPLLHTALFVLGLTYSTLAVVSLAATPLLGGFRNVIRHTGDVAPFAILWLTAMAFYYVTLGLVGPVFGVVLQSTRGLFSVLIGVGLQRFGPGGNLELPLTRGAFLRRLASAALMFTAIVLYVTG